jgi:hypothetical protein
MNGAALSQPCIVTTCGLAAGLWSKPTACGFWHLSFPGQDLLGDHREAMQGVGPEGCGDRNIRRVAAAGDQDPADARHVVARVKDVPLATDIGFEPGGKIHRRIGDRHTDIAEVTGAIARRDIQATAEGDREVGIIAAHAGAIAERLPRGPAGAGVFVAKSDVLVDVVAHRLDPAPSRRRLAEERPRDVGQPIGLAVAAGQQERQGIVGEVRHGMLVRFDGGPVRLTAIIQDRGGG